jgi:hypothetical protein
MAAPKPPSKQLARFIAKYDPEIARLAKAILARMRERFPNAVEMIYDNYNALAIGWGPSDRVSEVVCSIALFPRWVSVFFFAGAKLPDPHGLLKGKGKKARHLVVRDAALLDEPAVAALFDAAIAHAGNPFDGKSRRRMIIKSISPKQRPRRIAKK